MSAGGSCPGPRPAGGRIPWKEVVCADSLQWLARLPDHGLPPGCAGFTSIPDVSELDTLFGSGSATDFPAYQEWFVDAAALFLSKLPKSAGSASESPSLSERGRRRGSYCLFLQSDVRVLDRGNAVGWVDKALLCGRAADRTGFRMAWHKLVLSSDISARSVGRPGYSHFMCFTNLVALTTQEEIGSGYRSTDFSIPDVFPRGYMIWNKGIGLDSCYAGVRFLRDVIGAGVLVDPFCGRGTTLAMANALGMAALGVEISRRRCSQAARLHVGNKLQLISKAILKIGARPEHKVDRGFDRYVEGGLGGDKAEDEDSADEDDAVLDDA